MKNFVHKVLLSLCCFVPMLAYCAELPVSKSDSLIATVDDFSLTAKELDDSIRKTFSHGGNPYGDLYNVYFLLDNMVDNLATDAFLTQKGIPATKDDVIKRAMRELEEEALQKKMSAKELASKKRELIASINNLHIQRTFQLKWYFEKHPIKIDYSENTLANYDTWRDVSFIKISKGIPDQQKVPSFVAKRKALANEALRLAKQGTKLPEVCRYLLKQGLKEEDIMWGGPYLSLSKGDKHILGTPLALLVKLKPKQYSPIIEQPDGFEFYRVEEVHISPGIKAVKQKPDFYKKEFENTSKWACFYRDFKRSGFLDRIQWHSKAYHTIYDYYKFSHRLNDSEIGMNLPDRVDPSKMRARLVRSARLKFLKDLDDAIKTEKVGQESAKRLRCSILRDLWTYSTPQEREALSKQRLESLQDMVKLQDTYYYHLDLADYYAEVRDKQATSELLKSIQAYSRQPVGNKKEYAENFRKKLRELKRKHLVSAVQEKEINKALSALKK